MRGITTMSKEVITDSLVETYEQLDKIAKRWDTTPAHLIKVYMKLHPKESEKLHSLLETDFTRGCTDKKHNKKRSSYLIKGLKPVIAYWKRRNDRKFGM